MDTGGKDTEKSADAHPIRSAVDKVAGMFAQRSAIEHHIQDTVDLASATAKVVAGNVKVEMAGKKRYLEKRIDDARVAAQKK